MTKQQRKQARTNMRRRFQELLSGALDERLRQERWKRRRRERKQRRQVAWWVANNWFED